MNSTVTEAVNLIESQKPLDGLAFGQSSALLALMAIGESGYMQLFITSQWQHNRLLVVRVLTWSRGIDSSGDSFGDKQKRFICLCILC
jgi:hypothetical protein